MQLILRNVPTVERWGKKKFHTPVLVARRVKELVKESQKTVKIMHTRHVLTIFIHISFIFRINLFFRTCRVIRKEKNVSLQFRKIRVPRFRMKTC